MSSVSTIASGALFAGGAPLKLQFMLRLAMPEHLRVARRAALFVAVAWLPLLVLNAVQGHAHVSSFLLDFGSWARLVAAGPLLIAAEAACIFVLGSIARRFFEMKFVLSSDERRFLAAIDTTTRWRDAAIVEIAIAVLAFAISTVAVGVVPTAEVALWHRVAIGEATLSPAGWWHTLVSLPLLLMLLLGALWRLVVWTRFLVLVARLDLVLVPVHPDKAAGIGFVGYSVRGFGLVGAAFGALVAGTVAEQVVHHGAKLADFKYLVGSLVVVTVVLFTAPLLAFTPKLLALWRSGTRSYGELANVFGRRFEQEWFGGKPMRRDDLLDRGDFSAATDLYQVVDRLQDLCMAPVDLRSVVMLVLATLLPFVPVVLALLPLDVVVSTLVGLLR
jgi:hypothetical protein